jgi:hypothetical protein
MQSHYHRDYGAEALNCETYIQKISPHISIKDKTPYEAWSSLKPEVTHFHIFGSRAWAKIPSEKRKALDPQRTECIFVGYPDGVKGYRLIDISSDLSSLSIVSNSRKVSRMYLNSRMQTPSLFHLSEMMSMHMTNSSSDESSDSKDSDDSYSESVQSDVESEHPDTVAEPEKRPKWAQTTLQDVGDLVGDPADTRRTRSDFKEPPVALTATEPFPSRHLFLVQSSDP